MRWVGPVLIAVMILVLAWLIGQTVGSVPVDWSPAGFR